MCTPGRAEEVAGCPPAVGVTELEERFVECSLALLRVGGGMFSCTDMAGEGEQSEGEVDTVAGGVTYTTLSLANGAGGGSPQGKYSSLCKLQIT